MLVREDLDVGVATNTGPVRGANEDDYVLFEPRTEDHALRAGRLFAVADGMGGVSGGAEASRTAVRALLARFLQSEQEELLERVRDGFEHAARSVFEAARSNPHLADMGTTLTALALRNDGRVVLGHVGDSRCVRLRERRLDRLTEDHAIEEPRHLLTRCLGAGRPTEQVDLAEFELEVGDTYALMSDGTWSVLDESGISSRLRSAATAQRAAEDLVQAALDAGTTDNATALVLRMRAVTDAPGRAPTAPTRDVALPPGETSRPLGAQVPDIVPPRWPWVVLVTGVVVGVAALFWAAG